MFLVVCSYDYHTPLSCYEQRSLGHKARFEALLRALRFLRLFTFYYVSWITKTLCVGHTGRYISSQNQ